MHHVTPHQQLLNTQCHGLSDVWARAAMQEAREERAGPSPRRAGTRSGSGAALAAVYSVGVVIWLWVSPAESAALAWAGDRVPVAAESAS